MSMVEPTRYRPETDRPPDGVFLSADSGASWFVFAGTMPQYKAMVTFANEMYNQGLIDPESFTQADSIALQKLTSGKSFVISENAQYLVTDQAALPSGQTPSRYPWFVQPPNPASCMRLTIRRARW